jgi:hypothetical protein
MKKQERKDYCFSRAYALARTGRFSVWNEIEFELRCVEGFEEARGWLDSRTIREELDRICKQSAPK